MISNNLVSDTHLFAKSIKLQREQTKLTSHILVIHVTNTNEEINFPPLFTSNLQNK